MAKVCVRLSEPPTVGQLIPGVGVVTAIAGGPFENAECSKACCNDGQCVSKQFKYTTQDADANTPSADCSAAMLPTIPPVSYHYFYGSDAEFAASIPAQFDCPLPPLPFGWICCTSYSNNRGATSCDIKYVTNIFNNAHGVVRIWNLVKTWDMGEI